MASVQKITINLQNEKHLDYGIQLPLPLSNWRDSRHTLDFHSKSHEQISHTLQNCSQLVFGLTGNDSSSCHLPGNTVASADNPEALTSTSRFEQRLVSDCSSILLKRHCDKIIVSTALVKNRGEKQLFLGTDFLQWRDSDSGVQYSAPLILYPVQLFYNDLDADSPETFLLYADAHAAVENRELTEKIRTAVKGKITEFNHQNQQAFLLSVAVALQSTPEFSIQRKISINVLGTESDHSHTLNDHRLRRAGDRKLDLMLAGGLLKNRSPGEVRTLLAMIRESGNELFEEQKSSSLPDMHLRDYALALASMGLGQVSLRHVKSLPEKIDRWCETIRQSTNSPILQDWDKVTTITANTLAGINDCLPILQHAPVSVTRHHHADHAYRHCLPTLQRARFQHRLITVELDSLRSVFNLQPLPELDEVRELCQILDEQRVKAESVVNTRYFHARKTLSALFCCGTVNYGENEELQLKRLIKILRLRKLFIENSEYKLAFGGLFSGMSTDWRELESSIMFARQVADKISNETLAAHILEQWHNDSLDLEQLKDTASEASHAVTRLSRLLQIPADSSLPLDELLKNALQMRDKLQAMNADHEVDYPIRELNAQTILDSLETLEDCRQRFQNCSDEQSQELFRQRVLETINWMESMLAREGVKSADLERLITRMSVD